MHRPPERDTHPSLMPLSSLLGQERAASLLGGSLARGRVHHAYLFAGPPGVGKTLAAKLLAQALNCESEAAKAAALEGRFVDDPCGRCPSCKRVSDDPKSHAHPLVMWVDTEAEMAKAGLYQSEGDRTPAKAIGVRIVRDLVIPRLALTAVGGRRKVCIFRDVDWTEGAQNAFLKTLEEPPPDTSFVVISSSPDALKVTIRSRCLRVVFAPLPAEVVAQRVATDRKMPIESARLCAAVSGGNLGRALDVDEKQLARRRDLILTTERLAVEDYAGWLGLAEALGEKPAAEEALDTLETWFHDVLVSATTGGAPSTHVDLAEPARIAGQKLGAREILRRIELVRNARTAIDGNAQPRLQLERMVLGFAGLAPLGLTEAGRG